MENGPKKDPNGRGFLTENVIIIRLICSLIKFLLFAVLLRKSYIWEKSGSWDMDRIALS